MVASVRSYIWLSFGLSWGIGGIALVLRSWMPESRAFAPSSLLYYLAAYSISFSGIVLTAKYAGRNGLRELMRRVVPWRASIGWYLIALIAYLAITSVAFAASSGELGAALSPNWGGLFGALLPALVRDPGPIGEEFGWRGFALPRLLERYSPLSATLRLACIHAVWHAPLFFIPGMPQAQLFFPLFALGVAAIAVFDTALYLRTNGNLALAIFVHLLANVCGGLAAEQQALHWFFATEAIVALCVVGAGGLRRPAVTPSGTAQVSAD